MACAEFFSINGGNEYFVGHYLFEKILREIEGITAPPYTRNLLYNSIYKLIRKIYTNHEVLIVVIYIILLLGHIKSIQT